MNVLQEILKWSEGLPDWESDALSRLFRKQNLDSDDINDLYALLKAEYGIPDPRGRTANRLTSDMIPTQTYEGSHVELLCIKNLTRVNALANDQKLSFNPKGLTIIYGDNGSGKSGYSRVLKQACRARDQSEPILPNAKLPLDTGKAEAVFEICVDGIIREENWVNGSPVNDALSTIAIFDQRCARAYLDEEDDFSYTPYGLDIFEELAKVCNQLKDKIDHDLKLCVYIPSEFGDLYGSTAVGHLIENLSGNTELKEVEELANIGTDDVKQCETLNQSLVADKPLETAELLHRTSQRIMRVVYKLKEKFAILDNSVVIRYSNLDEKFLSAKSATKLANESFNKDGNNLPGTGGEAWRVMFEAARKYSEIAYPGHAFPHVNPGAKCLLCQQSLNDGAHNLIKFEEYVQQEIERTLRIFQQELDIEKQNFYLNKIVLDIDEEILAELAIYDGSLSEQCRIVEKELTDRYEKILVCFTSHNWTNIGAIPKNPAEKMEFLAATLEENAKKFEEASRSETRQKIIEQYAELSARIRFASRKKAVIAAIEKMRQKQILEKCHDAVRTNAISVKAKEIADKVITQDLGEALNREFKNLGVSDLNVELKRRSDRGKPLYKLRMNLSLSEDPINILSEGEQRAVAISSFLAEVSLNGGSCGIIFDDPVSSLDHSRREIVAYRLVQEAKKRQVIIFTHDLYFLFVLIDEAQRIGIPYDKHSLTKKHQVCGIPEEGTPFEGMKTSDRVKFLRNKQQVIAKQHRDGDEPESRKLTIETYSLLRSTWERAIEEVLFRQVIIRFRNSIKSQNLKEVIVDDSDYVKIEQGMSKCSKITEAHDTPMAVGIRIPDPDELLNDINTLDSWRLSVEKRSGEVRKRRK